MPWKGLKASLANKDGRSRSPFVDLQLPRHSEQIPRRRPMTDDSSSRPSTEVRPNGKQERAGDDQDSTTPGTPTGESELSLRPARSYGTPKHHRFSLLKFRHASDPQLSSSYAASEPPPVPAIPPPTIITTSPTMGQISEASRQRNKDKPLGLQNNRSSERIAKDRHRLSLAPTFRNRSTPAVSRSIHEEDRVGMPKVSFEHPPRLSASSLRGTAPPAYGDEINSSLALPVTRLSESSRSDASSGENGIYATTTTTHTIHTTTTFFRLPRRKKDKGPLFPLPDKIPSPASAPVGPQTPDASTSARNSESPDRPSPVRGVHQARHGLERDIDQPSPLPSPSHSHLALTNAPSGTPIPRIVRKDSSNSHRSTASLNAMPPPKLLGNRGRSSTAGSTGRDREGGQHTPSGSLVPSGRTSISTTGRKSIGDLFTLSHRIRTSSEPLDPRVNSGMPGTPGSVSSKPNSISLPRESLVYPERIADDTPSSYLEKLENAVNRGVIATILCKYADDFSKTCLRKYMRGFSYFGDAIDMAVRKMLMEVELPKETQQIDRLLQGFANRYCECNPGIFVSTDEAYFVAFSILLLHSDAHNKNNKRKMSKQDYIRNTQDSVEVAQEILECFFDNVAYTPFIHFDDEVAINSHRLGGSRSRKNLFKSQSSDSLKGPVDPYALILDNKLEQLRPSLKGVMSTEDTYSATGTRDAFDAEKLHVAFLKSSTLQIVSARSRPDAFLSPATITNPADAQAGLVDIKAAKVGLLWRKDARKKKTRSPWQEWGAILTSSQLYFFRDLPWIKSLISQAQNHAKHNNDASPVIFRPPLTDFKPDAILSMDDSVAMVDTAYKRHKNAFTFIKHGGFEEVFLANDEIDLNDWIAKLNYAATFRTTGFRMRGIAGTPFEGRPRSFARSNSAISEKTIPSATGDVYVQSRKPDQHFAQEIVTYRRQLMQERITEANEKLASAQKDLDNLLRNARHLEILSPIQQKTREDLVYAAGKMSAKLKWTRVEMWRTKCHRDILRLDMEEEQRKNPSLQGREPPAPIPTTPQVQPVPSQAALARLESSHSNLTLSPKSTSKSEGVRPFSSTSTTAPSNAEPQAGRRGSLVSKHSSQASLKQSAAVTAANADLKDDFVPQPSPSLRGLSHKPSTISSPGRSEVASITNSLTRLGTPTQNMFDGGDDRTPQDADVSAVSIDAASLLPNRPNTSESDPDLALANQVETPPMDRSKVRRSLHKTLRDSHGSITPGHTRSKKGRDSTSAAGLADELIKSGMDQSEGLTRSTGSFTVHGKKASVITFGQDWDVMSPEERLKAKREARESMRSLADIPKELTKEEGAADAKGDGVDSLKSAEVDVVGGSDNLEGVDSRSPEDVDSTESRKGKEKVVDLETNQSSEEDSDKASPGPILQRASA